MSKSLYPEIILASSSPRRRQLLTMINWPHKIVVPEIEEKIRPGETIKEYIIRNSREKVAAVSAQNKAKHPVLAADTVVLFADELLEKPGNQEHAKQMLSRLSGQTHIVWTSFCWYFPMKDSYCADIVESKVTFRNLSCTEISDYVATGSPMDKSGSYGIQDDLGAGFVKSISGSYSNIVGLPLAEIIETFQSMS